MGKFDWDDDEEIEILEASTEDLDTEDEEVEEEDG